MQTTDAPGLREAAEALKEHAWLERFRKASYQNKHHELSPSCANQIAGYVDDFLDKILATHPVSEEPITESSLLSHGWEYDGGEVAFVRYVNDSDGEPQRLLFYGDRKLVIGSYAAKCKTMPQLRHLLAALGCGVKI